MNILFHPEAEEEFFAAIDYYEERETGLGYDFSLELFTAVNSIVNHPLAWPIIESDIHRCLLNRFPYGILYNVEESAIYILAVMHQKREPGYWKERR